METKTILTILLICSIGLNVYFYLDRDGEPVLNPDCHITSGFGTPREIDDDQAARFAEEYKSSLSDEDITTGGIMTRFALEEMLCTEECNAIEYTLSRDESGTFGPESKGVFVVLNSVNVVYDPETRLITDIRRVGTKNFIGGYWCPPSCSP